MLENVILITIACLWFYMWGRYGRRGRK